MRYITIGIAILLCAAFVSADLETVLQEGPVVVKELGKYKRALALDIVKYLQDSQNFDALCSQVSERNASVDLLAFLRSSSASRGMFESVAELDRKIREAKGIADRVDSLLQIRLAFPEKGLVKNQEFLVTYIPDGNEKSWKYIEAFDVNGNVHQLDVVQAPEQQVIVVGLDGRKDMRAGLALLNEELRKAGMQVEQTPTRDLAVAKLNYIRLEDDQEPWALGDAEIYTLVNGIAPEASKANILSMEMPYLENDKTDYRPNQVLIIWDNYRYKAANLNIYEHDDGTNYKEIAAYLIEKIGAVVPQYQMIFEIASQIIKLMPDQWFSNDDDYVDVFYTLEMGKTYTNYKGASNNATITLVPYTISE